MNEEREKEELGELPEDLMRERNETQIADPPIYDPRRVPSDIDYQTGVDQDSAKTPPGTLTQGAKVVSTFDTRPVNTVDFLFTATDLITVLSAFADDPPQPGTSPGPIASFSFRVPEGRVALLRNIEVETNEQDLNKSAFFTLANNQFPWIYRIRVNGAGQTGYANIGSLTLNKSFDTHVLADSENTVSLELAINEPPGDISQTLFEMGILGQYDFQIAVSFYGQLILSTGRPTQFEIGEPSPTQVKTTTVESRRATGQGGVTYRTPTPQRAPSPQRAPEKRDRGMTVSVTRPAGGSRRGGRHGGSVNMGRFRGR